MSRNVKTQISKSVSKTTGVALGANINRQKLIIGNREASDVVYVQFEGSIVSTTDYAVKIAAGESYEIDNYTGKVLANQASTEFYEFE